MNNFLKDIKLVFINKKIIGIAAFTMIMVCALVCTHHNVKKEEEKSSFMVGVINNETSIYSDLLVSFFKTNSSFKSLATVVDGDKKHIVDEFEAGNIDAYIEIPEDFVNSLMYLEPIGIKVVFNSKNETETVVLKSILKSYERYVLAVQYNTSGMYDICRDSGMKKKLANKMNMLVTMNLIKKLLQKESFFIYEEVDIEGISLISHYIYVVMFVALLYMAIYAGIIVKREQYNGVYNLYVVSGGNRLSYVVSKALCITVLYMIGILCVAICGKVTGSMQISVTATVIFGVLSFGANMCCIVSSLYIKNINIYTMLFNISALLIVLLGGGIIPRPYLPDNLEKISHYLPFMHFEEIVNRYISF